LRRFGDDGGVENSCGADVEVLGEGAEEVDAEELEDGMDESLVSFEFCDEDKSDFLDVDDIEALEEDLVDTFEDEPDRLKGNESGEISTAVFFLLGTSG